LAAVSSGNVATSPSANVGKLTTAAQQQNATLIILKAKIYHLPFAQQHDRTKIGSSTGKFYATSVAEAEKHGFRRVLRHLVG